MLIGDYQGLKVLDVKLLIWKMLELEGMVVFYSEFEKKVMFRFGDECVVVLID